MAAKFVGNRIVDRKGDGFSWSLTVMTSAPSSMLCANMTDRT
jgi:hypothetical protein